MKAIHLYCAYEKEVIIVLHTTITICDSDCLNEVVKWAFLSVKHRIINKNSNTGFGTSCKTACSKMLPSNQTYSFKVPHCCLQQTLEWVTTVLNIF